MKKIIYTTTLVVFSLLVNAQIKVYTGGYAAFGSTSSTPAKPIDVFGTGGIRISRTDSATPANNELYFQDFGQIRSADNNHRIFFDRGSNILEFLEFGDIVFSANVTSGTRTNTARITKAGNMNITSLSNGYQINGKMVLQQRNINSCIFVGSNAGNANTAAYNSAVGHNALYTNSTGSFNDAFGDSALYANTSGGNLGMGSYALTANIGGANNVSVGGKSMMANTSGTANTVLGWAALTKNVSGIDNTATGYEGLFNTTGNYNTSSGYEALYANTSGSSNTAIGSFAGYSYTTGSYNTFLGYNADASGNYSNSVAIGNAAVVLANNKVEIGNSSITQIGGYQLWTNISDGRFKTNVTENVQGLNFIKKLRPVTYNLNTKTLDDYVIQNMPDSVKMMHKAGMDFTASTNIIHSGFIAQEVEQAGKDVGFTSSIVSAPSNRNDLYALSYAEFVVPLVKAVQELAGTVDSLKQALSTCCNAQGAGNRTINPGANNNNAGQTTTGNNQLPVNGDQTTSARLYQNIPNPFTQTTVVKCFIPPSSQSASLLVFDLNGSLKKTIAINSKGEVNTTINGRELVSGMYYYTLLIDGQEVDTKKMILTE